MASLANLRVKLGLSTRGFAAGAARAKASLSSVQESVNDLNNTGLGRLTRRLRSQGEEGGFRFMGGLRRGMSSAFGSLRGSFVANMQGLLVIGAAVFAALPTLAVAAAGGMVAAMGGGFAAIGVAALATTDKMQKRLKRFKNFVVAEFREAAQPLMPVLNEVLKVAREVITALTPVFRQFFSTIRGPLIDFVRQLGDAFLEMRPVIPKLARAFTKLMENLGPQLPGIFRSLANGIIAVTDSIAANPQAFTTLVKNLVAVVNGVLRAIAFMNRFNTVIGIVIAVLGIVAAVFLAPISAIAALIAAVIALAGLLLVNFGKIKNAIVSAWQSVTSWTSNAWNTITSTLDSAWQSIKSAAVSGIASLLALVTAVPTRILRALGDLGSLLYDAGRNLIGGLIDGIKSMIGAVGDAASSAAQAARDMWPFSPAKEGPLSGSGAPDKAGAKLAGMFASGMAGGLSGVEDASAALAGAGAVGAPSPRGVGRAGREQAPVPVRIDVTGADSEFKRLIRKMVRTDGRGSVETAFGNG